MSSWTSSTRAGQSEADYRGSGHSDDTFNVLEAAATYKAESTEEDITRLLGAVECE